MNFEEIKKKTAAFVKEELLTLEPWILNVKWEETVSYTHLRAHET